MARKKGKAAVANKKENKLVDGATDALKGILGFVAWLTGILVSIAVGFGMIEGILEIPYIPLVVMKIAGSIVVVLALLGAVLAIIDRIGR